MKKIYVNNKNIYDRINKTSETISKIMIMNKTSEMSFHMLMQEVLSAIESLDDLHDRVLQMQRGMSILNEPMDVRVVAARRMAQLKERSANTLRIGTI